jgi:hypothetical protein
VKGIPMLGEGAVYQVAEELIAEDRSRRRHGGRG